MVTKALKQGLGLACVLAVLSGCSSTSTTDTTDTAAAPVETGAAESTGVSEAPVVEEQLDTVFYFDFDKSMLKPEARAALTAHAERLKAAPRDVRLEGHADERGTREYNMALGERRAVAVREFLVLQGVDSALMEPVSYGEERPSVLGSNDASWEQNRRVELK